MRYKVSIVALCMVSLAACSSGSVKDTLGLGRSAPDEFRVVSRPPLSVPPQFSLRPPGSVTQAPNQTPASDQAKALVTGKGAGSALAVDAGAPPTAAAADTAVIPVTASSPGTPAESAFLKNAGADKADPMARDKLANEKIATQQKEDDSWWDIFSTNPPKKDPMVDAKKESARIEKDQQNDQPVTEGDTPTVKDKDTGVLGRIFGY